MTNHTQSRILYRDGDRPFSDTISVTPNQEIAVQVGALTVTLPLKKWHELGKAHIEQQHTEPPNEYIGWLKKLFGGQ